MAAQGNVTAEACAAVNRYVIVPVNAVWFKPPLTLTMSERA